MRPPTWDNPDYRGGLLLVGALLVVIAVEMLVAGLRMVGIAALLVASATALNYLFLRAVSAPGTVSPVHLWARQVANAGYLAGLVMLCLDNLWRITHHGDRGWFWVMLNVVFAVLLAAVVVRFVWAWLSGRSPGLHSN
jgi:hypothetical protein